MAYIDGVNTPGATNDAVPRSYADSVSSGGFVTPGIIVPHIGITAPSGYLPCDGSSISRSTYASLFSVITFQQTGTLTSGVATITGLASTANMYVGMKLEGTGIQAGTMIGSVDSSSQVSLTLNATANGAQTITFFPFGNGNGSTTFTVPDMSGRHPIGADSSAASVKCAGKVGGAFNHTHTTTAHVHTMTHAHSMQSHTHTLDHYHTMANHFHSMGSHTHGTLLHQHKIPTHGHSIGNLSITASDSHSHVFDGRNGGVNGSGDPRSGDDGGTSANKSLSTESHTHNVTGAIGSGTDASTTTYDSGAPSIDVTLGPSTNTTTAISTNNTSSFGVSTPSGTYTGNTSQYTGNTDSGGGSLTPSAANAPFLVVNFAIKT